MNGGGGWIRTNVDVRQRVYSPSPLATRALLRMEVPCTGCPVTAKEPQYDDFQHDVNLKKTLQIKCFQ